jgi:hypothetical protein
VDAFDEEARALLQTLEVRLKGEIDRRTDAVLFSGCLAWIAAGPIAFLLLGQLAELSILERVCSALLVMVPGFLAFGWLVQLKQEQAEEAVWRESIQADLEAFLARKGLSSSELLVLAQRLLPGDSRLAMRIGRSL